VKLEEKKQIVEDLHGRFAKSSLVILTDFKGLDVASVSELRRKLKEAGIEYKVVKNTLMARASRTRRSRCSRTTSRAPVRWPLAIMIRWHRPKS